MSMLVSARERAEAWLRTHTGKAGAVLLTTARDAATDRIGDWAAAIAFYALISVFPLLLAGIVTASYVMDHEWAIAHASALASRFLPTGRALVEDTLRQALEARRGVGVVSFLLLLWTGGMVFSTLTTALNVAYDAEQPYGPLKRFAIRMAMLLTIGVLALVAIGTGLAFDALAASVPSLSGGVARVSGFLGTTALTLGALFLTYHFVPRTSVSPRASLVGAAFATLLMVIARPVFVYYVRDVAQQNLMYGSLAAVMIVLLWMWIAATIVLLGGELAAHFQSMVLDNEDEHTVKDRHQPRDVTRRPHPSNERRGSHTR